MNPAKNYFYYFQTSVFPNRHSNRSFQRNHFRHQHGGGELTFHLIKIALRLQGREIAPRHYAKLGLYILHARRQGGKGFSQLTGHLLCFRSALPLIHLQHKAVQKFLRTFKFADSVKHGVYFVIHHVARLDLHGFCFRNRNNFCRFCSVACCGVVGKGIDFFIIGGVGIEGLLRRASHHEEERKIDKIRFHFILLWRISRRPIRSEEHREGEEARWVVFRGGGVGIEGLLRGASHHEEERKIDKIRFHFILLWRISRRANPLPLFYISRPSSPFRRNTER